MKPILLSIIIPVYNCESSIEYCVESIEPRECEDIEIVIVNDGSTDNSLGVCKDLSSKYSNVKIIDDTNHGVSYARNKGIENASGEWIMFVDADDYLEKGTVNECRKLLSDKKTELIHFGCFSDFCDMDGTLKQQEARTMRIFNNSENDVMIKNIKEDFLQLFENEVFDSACGKIYRRAVINENNIAFKEGMIIREDTCFVLEYMRSSSTVVLLDRYLYHYRILGDEDLFYMRKDIRLQDIKQLEHEYEELLKAKSITDDHIWNKVRRHILLFVFGGATKLISCHFSYKFSDVYNYLASSNALFRESYIKYKPAKDFYSILILLVRYRLYILAGLLLKIRFRNI